MAQTTPKNIIIVGGSLGGLFTGLALKRLHKGFNIRILERNPTPLLHDQGAGIVARSDVQSFIQKYDSTRTPLTVTSHERLYLDRKGEIMHREGTERKMTSWDLVYHILWANYDGVESEYAKLPQGEGLKDGGTATYEYGCTITDIKSTSQDPSSPMELTVQRASDSSTISTTAHLVIAADGPSSAIRSLYFPATQRKYAGYVAWRGTVPESQVSRAAADVFFEKFVFYHTDAGTTNPENRLVNWVWYVNYAEGSPEHEEPMTDKYGKKHHITLPPGGVQEEVWQRQKKCAHEILPPQFAALVEKTEGRVVLLGDALANFRPHTAASTSQAATDAMTLAEAVGKMMEGGGLKDLEERERHVVRYATQMQSHGAKIGNRSQFGVHPLRG
ncbi:monooxygenase [Clohesyomyces aquaticus]|uniref:Monooxygenase n=1 Tax=Clohesyomyces aquaticus TaxID=1231657 RepID=A0A1Y2A1L6_9PLEO|nr:monooxygenase [Clohesyomyces aquaticus]